MVDFRTIRIVDFGRVVTGKTPPSAQPELFGDIHPFLTPTDIDGFARHIEPDRYLSAAGRDYQHRLMLPSRAVCVVCIGATIGKVCMTDRPSFTNQQINSVVVNEDEHDPFFVYHLLTTLRDELKSNAGGAATPIINKTAFSEIKVNVPPLPVQQRIAGILSAYDELIENSQRRIKILESMARALYREWFVHFRFPGHENQPRVASPLGEIPQGWEVKKLGEVAEDMRRNVPKGQLEEPRPFVGLEHIPRRSLALDAWETATELGSNKLEFKKGEILFGKIRPYFHKVSVAPFDGLCSADTIVIRARRPEHYACVVASVSSDAFVAEASATANGAKMPRANWDVLKKYQIVIPNSEVAGKFSALVTDILAQQQALIFQIQNLRRTRDLLLPRLLSGQIDVEAITHG
jgi:type I restriction enzyme S subunit